MKTGWAVRLEGLGILALSIFLYFARFEGKLWVYLVAFLAPDLSFIAYAANKQVGAIVYNLVHHYLFVVSLFLAGYFLDVRALLLAALIFLGHSGLDRVAGYGLKYRSDFKDTHLQRL